MMRIGSGHHDMIDDLDVERPADLIEVLCCRDIVFARRRISAWMIMDEDDAGRIMFERAAEDRPWIYCKLTQRSLLQSLVCDQSPRTVEEENAQCFVGKRAHRGDEIAPKFGTERIDCDAAKISSHGFEGGVARANYERNNRRDVAKDTAKRISDALGTATEQRAMKNYAGHRLSPWLGHLMVSRTETARALLTPGEVMQLPPGDELVMASGLPPIRRRHGYPRATATRANPRECPPIPC